MKDSPLFSVVFPIAWAVAAVAAIVVLPAAALHFAAKASWRASLIESFIWMGIMVAYSVWRVRRNKARGEATQTDSLLEQVGDDVGSTVERG